MFEAVRELPPSKPKKKVEFSDSEKGMTPKRRQGRKKKEPKPEAQEYFEPVSPKNSQSKNSQQTKKVKEMLGAF